MIKLAENLSLPLEFATERIAFLARTGAGKSGGMRVMFEQIFDAGIFSIFVDPKGDAWGIRGDGIGKGRQVLVIGGDHGDIPITPTAGKVIAEFLVRERITSVVDISDFGHAEMWRFCADFFATLYKLNREVAHLFVDEIDMIAGQQFYDPVCLHGIQMLQNKGRGRGWGITVASQRPQNVNNTVLNGSGTYIIMQTIGDDALKVVKRVLGSAASKEVINEIISNLPTLQPRDAFVYSPQTLGLEPRKIFFDAFTTFDSMETPKPGQTRKKPKSLADIDLSGVKQEMAATIEEVKANDPRLLKKQLSELQNEVKNLRKSASMPTAAETTTVEVPVLDQEGLAKLDAALGEFYSERSAELQTFLATVNDAVAMFDSVRTGPLHNALFDLRKSEPMLPKSRSTSTVRPNTVIAGPKTPMPSPTVSPMRISDAKISGPQQKILDTLLTFEQLGRSTVEKGVIAAFVGVKATGSTMRGYCGGLSNAGAISYPVPGTLALTPAGRELAQTTVVINGLNDLHDAWRKLLGSEKVVEILNIVTELHPEPVDRQWLADKIGVEMKGSTMRGYLGTLRNFGLIDYETIEKIAYIKGTDLLFPEGLY